MRFSTTILVFLLCFASNFGGDHKGRNPGILVMAHGGSHAWNMAVERAVAPLKEQCPTVLALGMASRDSLQSAVTELESAGVDRIAVVRLFVSSESFLEQTEYFLGLRADPPRFFLVHQGHGAGHGQAYDPRPVFLDSRANPLPPIEAKARLALNPDGLYDSEEIGRIVVERVSQLSSKPDSESVLVLAHGEGDDALDSRWRRKVDDLADQIRELGEFRSVAVMTLREDWTEKRRQAEKEIRGYIERGNANHGRVIVAPFRVFGFGPYAAVLEGFDYVADGRGLLPHPAVTDWLRQQAEKVFAVQGWPNPMK